MGYVHTLGSSTWLDAGKKKAISGSSSSAQPATVVVEPAAVTGTTVMSGTASDFLSNPIVLLGFGFVAAALLRKRR